jgi:hypothetical protein
MINFRFHIISLVAVFLALALGIFLGSAVGEPTIVNELRDQIDNARDRARDLNDENDALQSEVDTLQSFVDDIATFTVEDRLGGVVVAVVAERGVDDGPIGDLMDTLRAAGADAPLVVWMEQRWELADEEDVAALASIVGEASDVTDETASTDDTAGGTGDGATPTTAGLDAETLRQDAFTALAQRLTRPPAAPADGEGGDLLADLVEGGYVSIEGLAADELATFPARGARALVVDGAEGDIDAPVVFSQAVAAFAASGAPTVAGEVTGSADLEAPGRGATLAAIRGDDAFDGVVSTIDALDVTQGRIAAVLALQQIDVFGDYGFGLGATQAVPELPAS